MGQAMGYWHRLNDNHKKLLILTKFFVLLFLLGLPSFQAAGTPPKKLKSSRAPTAPVIRADTVPPPEAYERTHGQTFDSIVPPYVEAYAQANSIDVRRIAKTLFPDGPPSPKGPEDVRVFISSERPITGNWTYITSRTILLYELMKVRIGKALEPRLLVLYNRRTPDEVILDQFEAEWNLAVLSLDYQLLSESTFKTQMKYHEEGLWDMIYADLVIESQQPLVRIRYVHTGGGGGRDQEFTFWFKTGI